MAKKKSEPHEIMVVNDLPGEECRIAILENDHLEELYSERVVNATNVGNIYKGRVVNVEPAIQAAFIDYGEGNNGFLHISDLHPRYFPGHERVERVGRKIPRRERPPIQDALKRGDEVLVQVLKEGIGTKGPTLTSYLSIPGRLLVVMPHMDRVGVSRKVEDEEGRREMRKILDTLDLPDGFGFILRTAGLGRNKTELKRDVAYLMRLWKVMEKRIDNIGAPCELYTESDLLIRTIRDVLRPSIQAIIVDSESAYQRVKDFLGVVAPRSAPPVFRYRRSSPIFHTFDVERQIELIHSREVPLRSGGRLVIDQTEALVAIDVNSGRSRSARDAETNAYQTNCEAVDEICRQLRLRDMGGLIIHDLIDMRYQRHRRAIEERFQENLKRDRAKTTVLPISEFGLMEMTRQRMRPSMRKTHFMTCPQCEGHGEVKSPESVAADVARHVAFLMDLPRVRRVQLVCSPRVASVLLSRKRRELVRLEDSTTKVVDVRVSDDIALDRVDYYAYDDRNADIDITHLPPPKVPSLDEMQTEDAARPAKSAAAAGSAAKTKRSRRRRRGGPADATAIALAGGFDEDVAAMEEEAETNKKKRSRRRRRRKDDGEPKQETSKDAVETDGPAEPKPTRKRRRRRGRKDAPETIRIHVLAKELDVASREVIEQCEAMDGVDVKNHMSSVPGEVAEVLREHFGTSDDATAATGTETGRESEAAPRRRRRRRRGGRGRGEGGKDERVETSEPAAEDAAEPVSASEPDDRPETEDDTQSEGGETKRKRRRSRRGGRRRRRDDEEPTAEDGGEAPAAEAEEDRTPETPDGDATSRQKRRSRRGRRSPTKAEDDETATPAAEPPPPEVVTAVEDKPATKKRRTLYGSRRKVGAGRPPEAL